MRCAPPANKPLPSERDNCADWLERELALLLEHARVIVCLGQFAWNVAAPRPRPRVRPRRRGAQRPLRLLGCFHPSQQNTFTGKLTRADAGGACCARARELAGAMKAYAAVLRVPHVAALIAATLLARFPIGINALAIMLYLRAERGSFAVAGAVAGALAAGSGIGAPVQGRLVDALRPAARAGAARRSSTPRRSGRSSPSTEAGAPVAVLVACGFVAGFAIPPTSSVLRSMWPDAAARAPASCCSPPTRSTRC